MTKEQWENDFAITLAYFLGDENLEPFHFYVAEANSEYWEDISPQEAVEDELDAWRADDFY